MSDTGQFAAAIIRYPASFLFRHQTDERQTAEHTGGDEFRAYGQKFLCLAQICLPRIMSRATDTCSRARIANEWSGHGRCLFAASSILALHTLSTCSSFRAKSSKMSDTGHSAAWPAKRVPRAIQSDSPGDVARRRECHNTPNCRRVAVF